MTNKMNERIYLDVSGQVFAIPREIIENGPPSRLSRMIESLVLKTERVVVNRPPESFAAVLAFYLTGELHIPMTSCPGAFMNELEYWGISSSFMSECCYNRLTSFLEDQDTLRAFKTSVSTPVSSLSTYKCLNECRAKLWKTIEYTKPSVAGKVYFILTFLMVLLSIFVMAYSTDPSFQRKMTKCERLEYMSSSKMDGYDAIKPYLEDHCADTNISKELLSVSRKFNSNVIFEQANHENGDRENDNFTVLVQEESLSMKTYDNTTSANKNGFPNEPPEEDVVEKLQTNKIPTNNTMNMPAPAMENGNATYIKPKPVVGHVPSLFHIQGLFEDFKVSHFKVKLYSLVILEGLTTIYFTVDIILRLSTCPFLKRYFLSVINCTDALSLLGAYAYFILYYTYPDLRHGSWIDNLAYIQMLRSLRFFRIVLNVRAGKVLVYTARKNIKDLSILVLFLITGMSTFSSCFYIAEDSTTVESIPDAWYWAVITMTTVGYGDIHPQTKVGRLISCVCAVCGVLLLALTVPIFANHFLLLYQHAESENIVMKYEKKRRLHKTDTGRVKRDSNNVIT